jgi:hypothetical protein
MDHIDDVLLLCSHLYSAVAESVDLCVPIHFIMRISCFWQLCVYQISREDKTFFSKHWEMLNFWGETHYLHLLLEGNEMNE